MDRKVILLRTVIRAALALMLTVALVLSLFLLLTQLNDPNPNAALTALLGSITGAMGVALANLVGAISSNPSDRGNGNED